jgi:ATP-binding cassette, subfamily B, bacterial PglK
MFYSYLKFLNILNNFEKKKLFILTFSSIGVFILEALSLGILIPLTKYIFTGGSDILDKVKLFFNFNEDNFGIILLAVVFFFFLTKNLLIFLHGRNIYSFSFSLKERISKIFFSIYLNADYSTNLSTSISDKTTALNQVNNFINSINSILNIFSEVLLLLIISVILIYTDFYSSLMLLIFLFITIIIYFFFKKINIANGRLRLKYSQSINEIILDSFNLIKEIIVFKKKSKFINKFGVYNKNIYEIEKKQAIIQFVPKLYFEIASITILLTIIYIFINKTSDPNLALTNIAIFTIAIVRILPSLNKVIFNLQNIQNFKVSCELIYNKLRKNNKYNKNKNNSNVSKIYYLENYETITIKDISFRYSNKSDYIFKNINLSIKKNDKICIYGPSGSGKTTLLNIILGLLKPTSGKILYNKNNSSDYEKFIRSNGVFGYVSQKVYLINDTIKNNILFGSKYEKARFNNALKMSGLKRIIMNKKFTNLVLEKAGDKGDNLSGGQAQRVAMARAIYHNSKILIFDEPTNHLDNESAGKILDMLKQNKNHTIVIISHDPRVLNISNKRIILH